MSWFRQDKQSNSIVIPKEEFNTEVVVDFSILNKPFIINRTAGSLENTEIGYIDEKGEVNSWYINCDNEAYIDLLEKFKSYLSEKKQQLDLPL